ncbi:MAG: hypothetical protein U9R23_08015 [Candidatus Cloacimonadota bacterium]|nr:hypothetical protein [Candidatus Cloacimonadota bacterium]
MINKKLLKLEIDKIPEEYLTILYKIIKSLEKPNEIRDLTVGKNSNFELDSDFSWNDFINSTYGSLSDSPIKRGKQGNFEIRNSIK